MQTPTSLKGLKSALRALGFGEALDGVDSSSQNIKEIVLNHIEWKAEADPNGSVFRRKKAVDLVNLFDWGSVLRADSTEIPAPEGTKAEVFTRPKKVKDKTFVIHSPTRSIELAAEAIESALKVLSQP